MVHLVVVLVEKMKVVVLVVDLLVAHGEDNNSNTGHGSSFVNDINVGSVSVALAQATTTFQNSDYTSEDQYNGWVKIEFIS